MVKKLIKFFILLQLIQPNLCADNLFEELENNKKINSLSYVPKESTKFYLDYLKPYFPKAYVTTEEYLVDMTPDAADKALIDIVNVLNKALWYYFQNKPKGFIAGEYVENLIEQCKIMHQFIQRSRVNIKRNRIFLPSFNIYAFPSATSNEEKRLITFWKEKNKTNFHKFYAVYLKYLVIMFNEGINFKILSQAQEYLFEIDRIFESGLKGSIYEARCNELLKRCKDLVTLLKKNVQYSSSFLDSEKNLQ